MPGRQLESLEQIERYIQLYGGEKKKFAATLSLYKEFYRIQLAYAKKVEFQPRLSAVEMDNCLRQGQYICGAEEPPIQVSLFIEILKEVIPALTKYSPQPPVNLEKLVSAGEFQPGQGENFLQSILQADALEMKEIIFNKKMDQRLNLDPEVLVYVLFMSLKPFYWAWAQEIVKRCNLSLWREGCCPVCGRKPLMARLSKEDGSRVLECWLCHTDWTYPRLQCPYCGNKDQQKMQFFFVDGDRGHRVYVCEQCRYYLKASDAQELGREVILGLENIFTQHLDFLAVKEGYRAVE